MAGNALVGGASNRVAIRVQPHRVRTVRQHPGYVWPDDPSVGADPGGRWSSATWPFEPTADLAVAVGREFGMHPDEVTELEYAALVHDIGRITLNEPAILRAGYSDEDIARWGSQIVAEAPHLARVSELVAEQYRPYRQAGQEHDPDVPVASKIIKVVCAYDKARFELELAPIDALEQVHRGSTYDFDPEVTASLRRVLVHKQQLTT